MYSLNSAAPSGTMRKGDKEPMSAAFATLLCVAPEKNICEVQTEEHPGDQRLPHIAKRHPSPRCPQVHVPDDRTVTIRQNANSTPGDLRALHERRAHRERDHQSDDREGAERARSGL